MSIAFRSFESDEQAAVGSLTISVPAGVVSGDLLIAFICHDAVDSITPHADFTEIDYDSVSTAVQCASYYRIADGGEDADYTWTFGTTNNASGHIIAISKTSGTWTVPTTANYHSVTGAFLTTIESAAVDVVSGDILLIGYGSDGGGRTVVTPPPDMDITSLLNSQGTSIVSYYEEGIAAGSPTKSLTWSAGDQVIAMAVVAHAVAAGPTEVTKAGALTSSGTADRLLAAARALSGAI